MGESASQHSSPGPSTHGGGGGEPVVRVVGGGLAGSECAWQLARRGVAVELSEMRPLRPTPAHHTDRFAELVCSNSLRSDEPDHPAGLLKQEMERFGSLIIAAARLAAVPAGGALAVDRDRFAGLVSEALAGHPLVTIRRQEVTAIPEGPTVLATGPLTSPALAAALEALLGEGYLYFYDAIAPIVDAETLDLDKLFWGSRYGKGEGADYLNAPLDEPQYLAFHQALVAAEVLPPHEFEQALFFEGCLPIEEMARRGVDTLRYGPLKPVGLTAPDGSRPWAVVQLRQENLARSHFNLVGFQSRLKWGDQARVLRMIPGLERAEFVRLGQIHRNTFVNAPAHLDACYRLESRPETRLAGQITGVEGYLESAATGLAIGLYLSRELRGEPLQPIPATTALGALARHLTQSDPAHFQPANVNLGLFLPLERSVPRHRRRAAYAERARRELAAWAEAAALPIEPPLAGELPPPRVRAEAAAALGAP
ncbi:MAG TPA: methylenetetrahydrofolate--tRNA-(uracil(54)-C(5))-methyltransferase (FADH(2)-oxidizing) TrmFO [Thermoanaerobaculia bacterium]|nr:methylenetetrahydrofolate--tRNA-(uracil(54)-C(5))-methyltransferase (FADH(2)-oxidizing) TrmFO [Thermoanaerobaculia bacterium]